jgi:DNA replication protein
MKWYEQNFVSHRDWVLDHLELLGLDAKETVVILMIDFCNEHQVAISLDLLAKKCSLSEEELNEVLSVLAAKKYLSIKASAKGISFNISGLFETETAHREAVLDSSLYDIFEQEFGRTLSPVEMQKISEWNRTNDKKLILLALREASAYQKKNFAYVDKILSDWKQKGTTAAMIEEEK